MLKINAVAENITKTSGEGLALAIFDGKIEKNSSLDKIDKHLAHLISETLKKEEFKGKAGEIKVFHTHYKLKSRYVFIVGLGESKKFELENLRKAAGKLYQAANGLKLKTLDFDFLEESENLCSIEDASQIATEGFVLGSYKFNNYRSKNSKDVLTEIRFLLSSNRTLALAKKGIQLGELLANATNYARDLINTPASDMYPELLGKEAKKIKGIRSQVYTVPALKKLKMGALLGVGQGSRKPPVFIEMIYKPSGKAKKVIALVGKGVTFDSGGLSLKPAKSMETMKDDMSAAATLLGVMSIIKDLKPNVEVRAYIPSAENMPGGNAIRPGDVLTAKNGKTIEVLNTDAEGRLILADALSYASEKKPDYIIDLATLTGACLVALGDLYAAILSNNKELAEKLIHHGKKSGEKIWELPLAEEYRDDMKSDIADMQNIGGGYGGTIIGGLFLEAFVNEVPWAHLDIAGPSWANKPWAYAPKGGTGFMVRTLSEFLIGF